MPDQSLRLGHPNPLDGHRHHNPSQTRTRLPQLQRLHRLTRPPQISRQARQPSRRTHPRRIAPELSPKLRINQQPLNQIRKRGFDFLING
jgi:hypothetical protein